MSVPTPNCCIPLGDNRFTIGRRCIVCVKGFDLIRAICPDCCKAIKNLKDNSKRNWIPDSKGGEPNYRR